MVVAGLEPPFADRTLRDGLEACCRAPNCYTQHSFVDYHAAPSFASLKSLEL